MLFLFILPVSLHAVKLKVSITNNHLGETVDGVHGQDTICYVYSVGQETDLNIKVEDMDGGSTFYVWELFEEDSKRYISRKGGSTYLLSLSMGIDHGEYKGKDRTHLIKISPVGKPNNFIVVAIYRLLNKGRIVSSKDLKYISMGDRVTFSLEGFYGLSDNSVIRWNNSPNLKIINKRGLSAEYEVLQSGQTEVSVHVKPWLYYTPETGSVWKNEEFTFTNKGLIYENRVEPIDLSFYFSINHKSSFTEKTYEQSPRNYKYKGVKIGEYYWSDVLSHPIKEFIWWTATVGASDRLYPIRQGVFDTYMKRIPETQNLPAGTYRPNTDEFTQHYGYYYDTYTSNYQNSFGMMYEEGTESNLHDGNFNPNKFYVDWQLIDYKVSSAWRLPEMKDYRQLFAMCPLNDYNTFDELTVMDVFRALMAKPEDNNITQNNVIWWGMNPSNTNMYRFSMMFNGFRFATSYVPWTNGVGPDCLMSAYRTNAQTGKEELVAQWWKNRQPTPSGLEGARIQESCGWWLDDIAGNFGQLFLTSRYRTSGGASVVIEDFINTSSGLAGDNHAERWCKRIPDNELGYKLFIKVNNINQSSDEWLALVAGNEIPLLQAVIVDNKYSYNQFQIMKVNNPSATAPQGYTELPNGYIRGMYVMYLMDKQTNLTVADIVRFACKVQDPAIRRQYHGRSKNQKNAEAPIKTAVETEISIYPNPVKDILTINISADLNSEGKAEIFSLTGNKVFSYDGLKSGENTVNISELASGVYLIKVYTESTTYDMKIIKQ